MQQEIIQRLGRMLATATDGGSAENAGAVFGLRPGVVEALARSEHAPLWKTYSGFGLDFMNHYAWQKWCRFTFHPCRMTRAPEWRHRVPALPAGHMDNAIGFVAW